MSARITMKQIASELGVSQTAVSFTLNGRADQYHISKSTQKRIRDFVNERGYVPNHIAAQMASSKSSQLGVIIQGSPNEKQKDILFGLIKICSSLGLTPHIHTAERDSLIEVAQDLIGKRVKAVVIIGHLSGLIESKPQVVQMLSGTQVIYVEHAFQNDEPESLMNNAIKIGINRTRAYLDALNKLKELGHKKVIVSNHGYPAIADHLAEIDLEIKNLDPGAMSRENWHKLEVDCIDYMVELIRNEGYTALSLGDDYVAVQLIGLLEKRGISIPRDLSLIGFDNIPFCDHSRVPLASIDIPAEEMLEVLKQTLKEDQNRIKNCVLKGQLIERASISTP